MLYYSTNSKLDTVVSRREQQSKRQEYFNSLPPSVKAYYSRIGRSKEIYNSIDFTKLSNDADWIATGEIWMRSDLGISKFDIIDRRSIIINEVIKKVNQCITEHGMDYFDQGLLFVNIIARMTFENHKFDSHLKCPDWFGYSLNCIGIIDDPQDYFIPRIWNHVKNNKFKSKNYGTKKR